MKITQITTRPKWSTLRWDYFDLPLERQIVAEVRGAEIVAVILSAYRAHRLPGSSAAVGLTGRIKLPTIAAAGLAAEIDRIFTDLTGGAAS